MKTKLLRAILVTLSVVLLMLVFASCKNDTPQSDTNDPPPDQKDETPKEASPILADLNNDGTDDNIFITYDNEEKTSATITIISGKDETQIMTDTLKLSKGKIGSYYLQIGKQNYPDKLVFWNHVYLNSEKLALTYSVFSYDPDGKEIYSKRENKTFDISKGANIASGNIPFGVMVEAINESIRENDTEYNAYMLLSNNGNSISLSTKENMLAPAPLTFTLESFVPMTDSGGADQGDENGKNDNTEPPSSEMAIEEGYTVIKTEKLTIPVTIDKGTVIRDARIAALRKENGENALYFDVLSEDGTVMTHITWKGYYQLFVNDKGTLLLMRMAISPTTNRGTALYQLFEVSDRKISGYDVIELETPQINNVAGEGESITLAVDSDAAIDMYEGHFLDLMFRFQDELKSDIKAGLEVYMLADCYLTPDTPSVYSDTAKTPLPNFEEKAIADKYTITYAAELFK
ncbi:MAG: hypothetical protein IJV70_04210 [Clostridia bacterium]|nr:hypothetical protein [Clostridia bacterium]